MTLTRKAETTREIAQTSLQSATMIAYDRCVFCSAGDEMRYLQSFRYLKAIVEAGSIRGAAENLAISPSALNRHIQTLEYDIDIQILNAVYIIDLVSI